MPESNIKVRHNFVGHCTGALYWCIELKLLVVHPLPTQVIFQS